MTVAELIKELQAQPAQAEVLIDIVAAERFFTEIRLELSEDGTWDKRPIVLLQAS
jgi:hypothetical protein